MMQFTLQTEPVMKTTIEKHICHLFANALSYPDEDYQEKVTVCLQRLEEYPQAAESFRPFAEFVEAVEITRLEELFTATFDLNDKRPLEVGWHLYGEEYKRGQFLVKMRSLLREYEVEESTELPDHLSHCLQLLPGMEFADAEAFTQNYLLPALAQILEGFDADNSYEQVIISLEEFLTQTYGSDDQ